MTKRFHRGPLSAVLAGLVAGLVATASPAAQIRLQDNFFADPSVEFQDGGFAAVLREDAALAAVLLANDPALGDPPLIEGGPGRRLGFDYEVAIAAPDVDEFEAVVLDGGTFVDSLSFSLGESGAGRIEFDLAAFAGTFVGIQFSLLALPGDSALGSAVRISNLEVSAIPLPAPLWLLASAGACLFGRVRRQRSGLTEFTTA